MKRSIPSEAQDSLLQDLLYEGYDFFTGVPDSSLKRFLRDLAIKPPPSVTHVRATWEAEAVGLAVGAMLSGRKACVYLQNSGLCFALNPLTSLCIPYEVYPLLVIGHRHTLPQHEVMGMVDEKLLNTIGWQNYIMVMH
jgi:phosphonopyruvate decarboxylase